MLGYAEYKESGSEWLGKIPAHWMVIKNKFLAKYKKGKNPEELLDESREGFYPYLSMDYLRGKLKIAKYARRDRSLLKVEKGQLLIIWDGSNAGEFIKAKDGILSSTMAVANLTNLVSYQFYWYLSTIIEKEMRRLTVGMGIPHVDGDELLNLYLCAPDIKEQCDIANFLDRETTRIDNLIAGKLNFIKLLKEKRQALISQVVTKGLDPDVKMKDSGVEWIGEVPEHWLIGKVGYYCKVTNGATPSKLKNEYWNSKDVAWLTSGAVNQYQITEPSGYITLKALEECSVEFIPVHSIVIGMIGQGKTRGMSAITKINATINQNLGAIIPQKKMSSEYLHFVFQAAYNAIRDYGRGSNQPALNCELISNFKISIPTIEEQEYLASKLIEQLSKLNALIISVKSSITLLQEYRIALISAAVTGKIDVRNYQDDVK